VTIAVLLLLAHTYTHIKAIFEIIIYYIFVSLPFLFFFPVF